MKTARVLLGAVWALALAAPAQSNPVFDLSSGQGLEASRIQFQNSLYDGYAALSGVRNEATDLLDAEHFNKKARQASRGAHVLPDNVLDRKLLEEDVPDLAAGWTRLRNVFDRGARHSAPVDVAQAQVAYDCWMEAAEGTNPDHWRRSLSAGREADVERCRGEFEAAIAKAEAAAGLELTPFRKPKMSAMKTMPAPAPAPAPAAAPQMAEAPKPFIVLFAFDSANLDGAGNRVIDDAVATAERLGITDFSVTGHTDRAGAEEYNLALSLQRADAVRDALVARGVKATGISVGGRGEAEAAVPTADGVRERANRRVEIILL